MSRSLPEIEWMLPTSKYQQPLEVSVANNPRTLIAYLPVGLEVLPNPSQQIGWLDTTISATQDKIVNPPGRKSTLAPTSPVR